ncbi:TetR/AcrR family transcriptional regulator [Parvibaculum sp. MBR-TMA-1.3b-4.2]|jgi:AcrR family transcriptional regulator
MSADPTSLSADEPRWQRRSEERPGEIMRAGLELFARKGFAATRLEDIADAAGVSKATIYLYFKNKQDLFVATVREFAEARVDRIEAFLDNYEGGYSELLDLVLRQLYEVVQTPELRAIVKTLIAEAGNFEEIRSYHRDHVVLKGLGMMTRIVEAGIKTGEFRPCDASATVQSIVFPFLMNSLGRQTFGELPQFDPEALFASHLEFVKRGLAADRES